jgi:hypothetical protein
VSKTAIAMHDILRSFKGDKMNKMFISKSNGKTWFQEGPTFLQRDFGEHPEDVAIIPSARIVSVTSGVRSVITLRDLHHHFEKIEN